MKSYCHLIIFLLLVFGSGRIYAQNDSFTPVLPTEPEGVFTPDLPAEPNAEEDPFTPDLPAEPQVPVFTVSFVGFGGVSLGEQTVIQGQSANAPNAPKVTGYTFKGWDTDFSDVQSDLTVRGIYVKIPEPEDGKFVVVFVDYDGTELSVQYVEPGRSAVPPQKPSRSGYLFYRWSGDYVNVRANSVVVATYVEIKTDDSQKKYVVFPCE